MPTPTPTAVELVKDTGNWTQQEKQRVLVYSVRYASPATSDDAATATGIPVINAGDAQGRHVISVVPDSVPGDPAKVFTVTVTYSNRIDSGSESGSGSTPYSTTISCDGVMYEESLDEDKSITGDPWGATRKCTIPETGEPLDPPIMGEYWDARYTIQFYVHSLTNTLANAIDEARGSINAAAVTMSIKGQSRTFEVRCMKLAEASYDYKDPTTGWTVKYILHYRKPQTIAGFSAIPGWAEVRQIKSFYHQEKNPTTGAWTGKLLRNKDANGKDAVTPSYLTSTGDVWTPTGSQTPVAYYWFKNPTKSWTTILSGITTIA